MGPPPPVDLAAAKANGDCVRRLIEAGLVSSVHDVSDGGVFCAATEMALQSAQGVSLWTDVLEAQLDAMPHADIAALFGEDQARYLCTVSATNADTVLETLTASNVAAVTCGAINGDVQEMVLGEKDIHLNLSLATLREAHESWLPRYMDGEN